ncbi:D-alanyl-D-alanine carboxypeptidase/D-alanyl-D-alanine-endopeptidase [Maribacter aestuarii]|uniref:D-alanyl-D-alanine carboxypeptidase/D-alanyl-D-alanine-endopeptidase n=1 Tax=Maribacter aestuarii TaxID=1130723 RepID=UPI00248ADC57|nr:D-alanyl-D-alanine carboxypeptidase [Maribacter aestuarii]
MKKILAFTIFILLLGACSSPKKVLQKSTLKLLSSDFYNSQFTGLLVVDPKTNDTILNYNGKKYFTPASNTKIFTLFTALNMLPDSIPAFKYLTENDTLYVQGTGDPTLLHPYFQNNPIPEFMKGYEHIKLITNNLQDNKFGPGWAWDDYDYYYQPEKGSFPVYGNVVTMSHSLIPNISPEYFKDSVVPLSYSKNRAESSNTFFYSPSRVDTLEVPFKTDSVLTKKLLSDALQRDIAILPKIPTGQLKTKYSVPTDTVLKRMMQESDNFLAEQLLILSSSMLSDTLSTDRVRKHVLENLLSDLKQPPRWVDGSGLSRYNLFTPESIVKVLQKMYGEIPRERLFDIFPAGGRSGTLESWYTGNPEPYIYAKSGSLGNVYCLSGYLITKSGKTLIFSFMNNHFQSPSAEVKQRMETTFERIRDTY